MLVLITFWILVSFLFLVWGNIFMDLWDRFIGGNNKLSIFDTFWVGLATIGTLLCLISLFAPISIVVLIAFIAIAIGYTIFRRERFVRQCVQAWRTVKQLPIIVKVILFLMVVAISIYASLTSLLFDTMLYHMQTMIWSENYSAVIGLGNVHGRLAFNSTFLLLSTLLSYHPDYYAVFFPLNSLVLAVFMIWAIIRITQQESYFLKYILFFISFLCFFFVLSVLSSTSTDIAANLLVIYILVGYLFEKEKFENKTLVLFFMSVFCITLKLSTAPLLLLAVFILICLLKEKKYKFASSYIVLGLIIGIPWIIRFVMLSGYLIYPFPAIDIFDVDWKIPESLVILEKDYAHAWAKIPFMVGDKATESLTHDMVMQMSIQEWFPYWYARMSPLNILTYFIAFISPVLLLLGYKRLKDFKLLVVIWAIAYIGHWFGWISAPEPRFSLGFIYASITISLIPLLLWLEEIKWIRIVMKYLASYLLPAIFILLFAFISFSGFYTLLGFQAKGETMYTRLIKPQDPRYHFEQKINPVFKEFVVNNKTIYYPTTSNQCFDHEIPCLEFYSDNIEMRGNEFKDGFRNRSLRK